MNNIKKGALVFIALTFLYSLVQFGSVIGKDIGRKEGYKLGKLENAAVEMDINKDKKTDYILPNKKIAFISTSNGKYEEAQLVSSDGVGFFKTPTGVYDFHGNYFPNKPEK